MTKKISPQTPLGQLLEEKRTIRRQYKESESRIKDQLHYIRSHAGRMLLSEMANVFMPGLKKGDEKMDGGGLMNHRWMHLIWQILRPFVYRWMGEIGWQVFKSMFRKKK